MCCRVAACCFLSDLRLATLLIAVFCLVGNVGVFAFTSYNIRVVRLALVYFLDDEGSGEKGEILVRSFRVTLAVLTLILLTSMAAIGLDVVLFLGAFRRRRGMLHCWSQGHAVVSGAYLIYFWFVVVDNFASGSILLGLLFLGATIFGAVATVYFWVVVRSFDLRVQRSNLGTVSAGCPPTLTASCDPAPAPPRASWAADKPSTGTQQSPPPYSSRP